MLPLETRYGVFPTTPFTIDSVWFLIPQVTVSSSHSVAGEFGWFGLGYSMFSIAAGLSGTEAMWHSQLDGRR